MTLFIGGKYILVLSEITFQQNHTLFNKKFKYV